MVQKVARKLGKTVVVASTHHDFLWDFQPDIVVKKGYENDVEVTEYCARRDGCSIFDKIQVENGCIDDYY
ncbi:MAG: hypothetical protein CW691_05360 [Candidatus Bathyarchaeum sp.]|nr:MAG: hypothetical protein CW691_05360 [Candidatus Bathyarchaeum sp.]